MKNPDDAINHPKSGFKHWRGEALRALFLVAVIVLAYGPALRGGFLWDDDAHISTNNLLRSRHGLLDIWLKLGATEQYYPLTFTVFWAGYHLWELNPLGYHLTNALMHALTAILLWQLLGRLKVPGAFLAGAIFALHPVCVMSVAWMTELKNTLSGVLALAAGWAYLRFAHLGVYATFPQNRGVDRRFYVLCLLLFQLALFAKTAVSFLPVLLCLIVWWQRERVNWRDFWTLLPMLGMAIAMGQVTSYVERHTGTTAGDQYHLGFAERILISGRSFWFYLGKIFFPYRLTFIYERWQVDARTWWQYLYPAATVGLLTALWFIRRRIGKGPLVAMLHFYISTSLLIFLLVLYMTRYSFVSDHWQYFGCMGVIALVAAGISAILDFGDGSKSWLKPVFCGMLLSVLGILTWRQSRMYTKLETLWRTTLSRNPDCSMACNNLGLLLQERGQLDEALPFFQKAVTLQPDNAEAWYSLGHGLFQKGRMDEAIVDLQKALAIRPDDPEGHNNLGCALFGKGMLDEAIVQFQKAVELGCRDESVQVNLSNALLQRGRVDEAIAHFRNALELQPRNIWVRNGLAWVLATFPNPAFRNGAKAVELAQQADQLSDGKEPVIIATYAAAQAEAGRFAEAVATAQRALPLATSQNNTALVNSLRVQIALYRAGCPFRDLSLTDASAFQERP